MVLAPKVEHDMQAMSVDTHDQAGHNLLDDLAKSKGDDSQVVAAQAKHGNADDKSGDGCKDGANDDAHNERERLRGARCLHGYGGNDARVGADAHEAGMAKRKVARDTDHEVREMAITI